MTAESLALRDRPPNPTELERLRLTLSGFRDGSGQLMISGKGSYPGWRDFERAVAAVFGGTTMESKAVFDVVLHTGGEDPFGISCKTRAGRVSDAFVLMELSNSAALFWRRLRDLKIDPDREPERAGPALIALVEEWHEAEGQNIDLAGSSYLHLSHTMDWRQWRLAWYPLSLRPPDGGTIAWEATGSRIVGRLENRMIWEWYGQSGGQLKFYPPHVWARWVSDWFELEEPPAETPAERAARYWPQLWPDLDRD
jgi:hypothetical protein